MWLQLCCVLSVAVVVVQRTVCVWCVQAWCDLSLCERASVGACVVVVWLEWVVWDGWGLVCVCVCVRVCVVGGEWGWGVDGARGDGAFGWVGPSWW